MTDSGLPQITVVDKYVYLETTTHDTSTVDVWEDSSAADRYVTFLPALKVGDMLYGPLAEETNKPEQVTHAKVGPVLISKWSDVDPIREFTSGSINAFPSFHRVEECWFLDTESNTTYGA